MFIPETKTKVADLMLGLDAIPIVAEKCILKDALEIANKKRLGIVCIADEKNILLGVITDGDIRRLFLRNQRPSAALFIEDALDYANRSPVTTASDETLFSTLSLMEEKKVWDLPVVGQSGELLGLLHLHSAVLALMRSKS